jgi:hypothetical protein
MDAKTLIEAAGKTLKVVPDVYEDGLKPTVTESGKFFERIPRAINAALVGIDIWIANRQYKFDEVKALLAKKLENVNPENIVPPEPYVAIPAWQGISYSMDSDELKELYANLLAKSMNSETKNNVHPGFAEIIMQMSPLDAENLSVLSKSGTTAIANYAYIAHNTDKYMEYYYVFLGNPNNTDITSQSISINSLNRLGLVIVSYTEWISDDRVYSKFEETDTFKELVANIPKLPADGLQEPRDNNHIVDVMIQKGIVKITPLGKAFIDVCLVS